MPDNTFDVVSKIEMPEVVNSVQQAQKELQQRYDLKNSGSSVEHEGHTLKLASASEMTLDAVRDLVGPSQLLFGTDYPFWSPNVAVKVLDDLGVAGAERERIERGNALGMMPALDL